MPKGDHYAIVVGLTRYPALSEPPEPTADLKGPENDADAVAAWLTSTSGGDLPSNNGNVTVIKSSDFTQAAASGDAKPTRDEIEKAFTKLDDIARKNNEKGLGNKVGRRLYIYMAGHGFSPRRNHGCLFAANATPRFPSHVYPSSWLEWFQDAAYFDEFVLWMDCCMNRQTTLPPSVAPAQPLVRPSPAGPTFIAFAAQRPLKAVERKFPEDDDKVHGVFTWTLLEGLQGAAADGYGMVTGRSLADWLRNAQKTRMDKRDLEDRDVAEEPEVSREDSGIVFARGLPAKAYDVRLSFPLSARGHLARLWSGRPLRPDSFQIDGDIKQLLLRPGLYVLDVPDAGLRHGFEVTGPKRVNVSVSGDHVADRSSDIFPFEIDPENSATEIFIVDERFALVDRNAGRLHARLPFGIYKVKTRLDRIVDEQIILLDRDTISMRPKAISIASPAPLPNTTLIHEYHVGAAAESVATIYVSAGTGARLSIMTRAWSDTGQTHTDVPPWTDVRVVNARGKVVADLSRDGDRESYGDPFAVCSLLVEPGTYFLRHRLEGGTEVEQSLIVPANWFLQAYLLRLTNPGGVGFKPRPRLSFIMHRSDSGPSFSDQILTTLEAARVALADERRILGEDMERLLLVKFDNPIAGIIGGHLLLIEQERDSNRDIQVLNEVVTNLRHLVGDDHPDVEALSLRCPDTQLRRVKPIKTPPMFQRSWTLLFQGSQGRPSLLPRALWNRVQAHSTLPPYLIWAADEASKEAARDAVVNAMLGLAGSTLQIALPLDAPIVSAATRVAQHVASTPHFKKLSKQILDLTEQNAVRLQVPPSALNDISQDVIKKLKG